MVLWSNFTFPLWTLNYDPHRKGPYCPSVICDSVVFIIHSGADCEIFSMIWLTWKHRLWICLSHVGRASRAAIIIAHPFTTKVHDQPFTPCGFCITTKVRKSRPHRSCSDLYNYLFNKTCQRIKPTWSMSLKQMDTILSTNIIYHQIFDMNIVQ